MLYRIPDYYKEFCCVADACEATCCAGWGIAIDPASLDRYKKVQGSFGKRLCRSVNWHTGTFHQSRDGRCAFLNEKNLCDLYIALGGESLCKTCRMYPRHVEEFENVREITLSLSCPRVAQILMAKESPTVFYTLQKEGWEEYDTFDMLLYEKLCRTREVMRTMLQDRRLPVARRAVLVLGIAHDIQRRIRCNEMNACDAVLERGLTKHMEKCAAERVVYFRQEKDARFRLSCSLFGGLHRMETVQTDWKAGLCETEYILFAKGAAEYNHIVRKFNTWMMKHMPQWQVQCEQLIVYFMDTYYCGAVYDGRAYAKMKLAVASTFIIEEMLRVRYCKSGGSLDEEDVVRTIYRFCREIEHSDRNLEIMENAAGILRL